MLHGTDLSQLSSAYSSFEQMLKILVEKKEMQEMRPSEMGSGRILGP